MLDYYNIIVNALLNRFEKQDSSLHKLGIDTKIKLKLIHIFDDYYTNTNQKVLIDDAIITLIQDGYISATFLFDDYYELILKTHRIDDAYLLVNRLDKHALKEQAYLTLKNIKVNSYKIHLVVDILINKIINNEDVSKYIDINDINQTATTIYILDFLFENDKEYTKEDLSKLIFNDNNSIDNYLVYLNKIAVDLLNINSLNRLNIIDVPTPIYLKGDMIIKIAHQTIDLSKTNYEYTILSHQINQLEILKVNASNLIVVENINQYFNLKLKDSINIHFYDYPNYLKVKLITLLSFKVKYLYYLNNSDNYNDYLLIKEYTKLDYKLIGQNLIHNYPLFKDYSYLNKGYETLINYSQQNHTQMKRPVLRSFLH